MEYEQCYIFEPKDARPSKRRRIEDKGLHSSWPLRREIYQRTWQTVESDINARLTAINVATHDEIRDFLETSTEADTQRLPAGFILAGPISTFFSSLASRLTSHEEEGRRRIFVRVACDTGSNLKGVLKNIIRQATRQTHEDEDDELDDTAVATAAAGAKGRKLLNYDLQILHDYVQEHGIHQVVLAFDDTEAFDGELLSEIVEILHCWHGRIPLALLFNIATSIDFLQQRLSQSAVRCLRGRAFDSALVSDEVEQVFDAVTGPQTSLWIGSSLASMILERQRDYTQSISSMVDAVRYAYMCGFYANALTIFMGDVAFEDAPTDHFEALRNTDSFRILTKRLLDDGQSARARALLESDRELFEVVQASIREGQSALAQIAYATEIIRSVQDCLPDTPVSPRMNLYIQAMSGRLSGSPLLRNLLLSTRKAPSDVVLKLMQSLVTLDIAQDIKDQGLAIYDQLAELVESQSESAQPLRSEHDVQNSTLRTTVIAQKVSLSKQKAALSKQDAAYSALLRQFTDLLESYLHDALVDPHDLPMHEIFLYDAKSPHREVFTPRPRHAVERALAAPHDYLDCDCCVPDAAHGEASLAATQPATAILYQLYLESGSLINVSDLWQAYNAVVAAEDEQHTMAMFQRGLAELRYLGVVKSTRRRVDHVAKVAWKGL